MPKKQTKAKNSWSASIWSAVAAYVLTYLLASWAVDSGSLLVYFLAFAGFYYAVYYTKEAIKYRFFSKTNDKTTKARAAKKAH